MRFFLVCNPGSRGRKGRGIIGEYLKELDASGASYEVAWTGDLDGASELAREASGRGFDAVVAAGGDGTINRVINGLFGAGGEPPVANLGVLYAGTSPDFCKFHGIPTGGREAVENLLKGHPSPIDLCEIRYEKNCAAAVSRFSCSANIGLGPSVAARANGYRPLLGDFLGTLLATLVSVAEGRRFDAEMELDGERTTVRDAFNISAGKNPFLASGLKLAIGINPSDGRLFVFALSGVGRCGLFRALPAAYSGKISGDARFFGWTGTSLKINILKGEAGVEFDGDPAGDAPVEIAVLPGALRLIGARR